MLEVVRNQADRPRWATEILSKWKWNMDAAEVGPTLFQTWFDCWMQLAWSDNFKTGMRYPDKHVAWQIYLEKNNSDWFDFAKTKEIETGSILISRALHNAIDSLDKKLGPMKGNEWAYQWGNFKATQIEHLAKIGGLGTETLFTGGGKGIVNATAGSVGQSWKFIVEMGPKPNALGIYPGGQSGNPASAYYNNLTEPWRNGKLKPLQFKL